MLLPTVDDIFSLKPSAQLAAIDILPHGGIIARACGARSGL